MRAASGCEPADVGWAVAWLWSLGRPLTVCWRLGFTTAEHEVVESGGGGLVHAGDDVLVGVGGEGVGVVAETFLHDLDVDAREFW